VLDRERREDSSSAWLQTFPVGLCGVLRTTSRVRGPKSGASSSLFTAKSGKRSVAKRGTAPAIAAATG